MATKYSFSTSSSGFIDGLPTAAALAYKADAGHILTEAIKQVIIDGNKDLKAQLSHSDLWEPYADKVDIRWDEDRGEFTYALTGTPEENAHMRDLEYGTPSHPPTAMLRKHAFRLGDLTSKGVEKRMREVIGLG